MNPCLIIVSLATGYGGTERSIEVLLQHLPENLSVRIYAEAPEHLAQLARIDRRGGRLQVLPLAGTATSWGRKRLALRLAYYNCASAWGKLATSAPVPSSRPAWSRAAC